MNKEKINPSPVETVLERPDLYVMVITHYRTKEKRTADGVWLRKGGGKVCIKAPTFDPWPGDGHMESAPVGTFKPSLPAGPKYTGPIDDEMMANILMFGG